MSAYQFPPGHVQVAFSGGRTSAYMLRQLLDANGPIGDAVVVTFQNTGREMPETLDFVHEVGRRWAVKIVWLEYRPPASRPNLYREPRIAEIYEPIFGADRLAYMQQWWDDNATDDLFAEVSHNSASRCGEPLEVVMLRRSFLANQASRFCTIETKVRTAKRYLRSLGWDHWTNCVGLRADEPHRLNKPAPKDRWTVWHPLATAGVTKTIVGDFWRSQPFDLNLPNVKGNCWLGNCDGCFLKSEANVAAFARSFPERAAWWEQMEAFISGLWPSLPRWQRLRRILTIEPTLGRDLRQAYGRPIRPSVIDSIVQRPRSTAQWSKRYTRAELREFMERQGDWALTTEGVLCQADDGECTG